MKYTKSIDKFPKKLWSVIFVKMKQNQLILWKILEYKIKGNLPALRYVKIEILCFHTAEKMKFSIKDFFSKCD